MEQLGSCGLPLVPLVSEDHIAAWGDGDHGATDFTTAGVPFIQGQHLHGAIADFPGTNPTYISPEKHNTLRGSRLHPGDLLVVKKGSVGFASVLPHSIQEANTSAEVAFFRFSNFFDPYSIVAYFCSKFGQASLCRLSHKSTRPTLGLNEFEELYIPKISPVAQKYIGDKVRQAELLRDTASKRHAMNQLQFESRFVSETTAVRYSRMDVALLGSRLDYIHYRADLLGGYRLITNAPHVVLGDKTQFEGLTDGDHGNPEYGNGPIYLRASEMDGFVIYGRRCARLSDAYAARVPTSCFGTPGDVVFSIVGTLGLVAPINGEGRMALSRGIAKVRPLQLPQHYVKAFMRSRAFGNELLRNSVGSVQRGVYLEALESIPIPVLDVEAVAQIAEQERTADAMLILSESLIATSKQLVEGLIERNISEGELEDAQRLLERRDQTLDRAILSRLTEDGIDGDGKPPLFANLDVLYAVIDEAQRTQPNNGDAA